MRSMSKHMIDIPAPSVPPDDENRHLLCQMAIEIPLQEIVEAAVKAGWEETEVLTAIIEVADNLVLAHGSNAELDALLKAIRRNLD
ncbi:Hypothetical protein NGAL_HAMBI1146_58940 [Neorhizobium galegae bv. officinalis]|nr:Hypothetical protein NGAL_HAMBI1146_58940 [Neorhizobium galegae bv. officinalis]